jgi:hypothetical protein
VPTAKPNHLSPIAVWILFCTLLNAAGWGLSAVHQLNFWGYAMVFLAAGAVALWWHRRIRPTLKTGFRLRRFKKVFPLAFAVVAALALLGGLLHAPVNYDALAYRTPRVLHWLAENQWHWIHTDFHRLNTRGSGFEWLTAPLILFTRTDRLFFLINAISLLLLPGLSFRVLTGLGVRRKVAWHWMWVLPCGYCYILQAGSIGNDLFGATLALAAVDYALKAARERNAPAAWLSILAAALMTAGKGFNLLILLPWGLAMLPTTLVLLRRPLPTFAVGLLALSVSLVPTSLLNLKYCGDWKGLAAEPVQMATGEPLLHLGVNSVMITLQNFSPTFFPAAAPWKRWLSHAMPDEWVDKLRAHFEGGGIPFGLPEIQMEEGAGLGFGVSLLLATVLLGRHRLRRPFWTGSPSSIATPAILVAGGAWLVVLYFFTQSGLGCPARYLAPLYIFLLVPVLRLPRAGELIRKTWWRGLALSGFILAALLVIVTPPRPLWPAQTLLRAVQADTSTSPILKRIWTVYSVYGARADGFAPVRATLPTDLNMLGLLTFDDPETSLWKPFGSRRILHVTRADTAQSLRDRGIKLVLVSEYILQSHQNASMDEWLARYDGEILHSLDLILRAGRGPTRWHLVRIRPDQPAVQ